MPAENVQRPTSNAQSRIPEKTWTLPEIVSQLEWCNYECEAGPLKNNVAFIALTKVAQRPTEIEVGKFTLRPFHEGSVFLENELGEGMQIFAPDFERLLADYWERNF